MLQIGRFEVLLGDIMGDVNEFKYLGTMLCNYGDGENNKREGCERQVCYRISCKFYKTKECVNGGKERIKDQYFPANIDIGIRNLYME